MTQDKTLLVIDGSHLAYKCYFAVLQFKRKRFSRPGTTQTEIDYLAAEETCRMLGGLVQRLLERYKPTNAVIIFDDNRATDTFRYKLHSGYKQNRKKKLLHRDAFILFKTVVKSLGVNSWTVPEGYEADDLIGSIVTQFKPHFDSVLLHSGDKDFMQLVSRKVTMLNPNNVKIGREAVITPAVVKAELGVWPNQVVDYKALVGDSSDGYKGVDRIGEKSAVELLEQFKDLDEIMAGLDQIKAKVVHNRLKLGYDDAMLCRTLAKIVTDLDLGFEPEDTQITPNPRLYQLKMRDLRRMTRRYLTEEETT